MHDLRLTAEHRQLRELAVRVAREEYAPHAAAWDGDLTLLPRPEVERLVTLGHTEYRIEWPHRDAQCGPIAAATPAIQRVTIAAEIFGRPFNQRPAEVVS